MKLYILLLFFSSVILCFVSNAQEAGTAGVSGVEKETLRIYKNRGGDFELTGPDGKEISSKIF